MGYFHVRHDSISIIYDCRDFIRLTAALLIELVNSTLKYLSFQVLAEVVCT